MRYAVGTGDDTSVWVDGAEDLRSGNIADRQLRHDGVHPDGF